MLNSLLGCPLARSLWSTLSPAPHPALSDFVRPVVSRSERRLVKLRILFFHAIWKLLAAADTFGSCNSSEFSRNVQSEPLKPITETAFEDLRASIQAFKGYLVSL
ncbi:BQ5605_C009g05484 [Microbotryum silenes-dioicae]|uniref:BQ5605_C009g05484 protein n=1 Tax=Microbotryum silenes-dioicae TaxID=796604 RepID=A0A2X0MDJ5_9BASI|nr:BQ5605_C009g05484 [Microbotryum silenes-dioicae]